MSTGPAPARAPSDVVGALEQVLMELEAALAEEADAIGRTAPDALLRAVDRKRQAVRSLAELSRDGRVAGLRSSLDPAHAALLERLRGCRDRNLAAGAAVASARRTNDSVLELLGRGFESPGYHRPGSAGTMPPRRELGTA